MPIVEVNNLSKTFYSSVRPKGSFSAIRNLVNPIRKAIPAVTNVNFTIEKGESVAYLGPNGAGKSTTIKMLTGILVPTNGTIKVGGIIPHKNRSRNSYQIGAVFGQRSQLLFDLPVIDSFDLLKYMYSIPNERYKSNLKRFSQILEVEPLLEQSVRTLSLGQRMRCEILAALLHDPEILFLDEPTIGLDVVAKESIRQFIKEINKEKSVTVLLTTHDLGDIEHLCERLIIIDKGTIVYDGDIKYIKKNFSTERQIEVLMENPESAKSLVDKLKHQQDLDVSIRANQLNIRYNQHQKDTAELLRMVLTEGNPKDISTSNEDIEALIGQIYKHGIENIKQGK